MKALCCTLLFISVSFANLQSQEKEMGLGFYQPLEGPCLSQEERQKIQAEIDKNVQILLSKTGIQKSSSRRVELNWPLQASDSFKDYSYYGISNFVDQNDAFPGQLLDYNCGQRTYDRDNGYNHAGIDYFLWPFTWHKMDSSDVEIVAAAPGVIINKQGSNRDRNCSFTQTDWNAVYIRHEDGSVAWYGHMKRGSTTTKAFFDSVSAGEYLGVVGSSGNSTGPHLHFELHDDSGNLIDPYAGNCNNLNRESWWKEQKPYYDSAINALKTHWAPPLFQNCDPATINEKNVFQPGEEIYFVAYYRDQLAGQISDFEIKRPDGSTWLQWQVNSSAVHYSASYWWFQRSLPTNAPEGTWTLEVEFEGETYMQNFTVSGSPVSVEEPEVEIPRQFTFHQNFPNPFNPSTSIRFDLAYSTKVDLIIYNIQGQVVRTLVSQPLTVGRHSFTWDSHDEQGNIVPSGLYISRLRAGNFTGQKKMLLIK